MCTRNGYVKLSKLFNPHINTIQRLFVAIGFGGFALLFIFVLLSENLENIGNWLGKIWFTSVVLLGVIYMACETFNPERDPVDKSPNEQWAVIVLNIILVVGMMAWFFE